MVVGRDYSMGTATRMGPAYFPTVLGALLALIGLAVVLRGFLAASERVAGFALQPLLLVLVSTVLFGAILRGAGLVAAVLLLTLVSALASRHVRWRSALVLAAGLAGFSAAVFVKALGLPMPLVGPWLGG